ncbi:MAG: hybrid sensor histidine kinase/response regulator [Desulfobacterales bacterium]|jgi:signal transduction histidine kinase
MENTVLLVDDEEDIRDVIGISLSDLGYEVLIAESGQQALRLFEKHSPPIVLTDIKMPGIDGIELLRRLKELNPDVEVIMITGHGAMDLAIMSLKYAATDFITKPINVEVLEVALGKVREKIKMKQQLREYTQNLERLIAEKTQLQDHLSSLGLMIGSISHGIKGLLTGLDGGMYLLESGFSNENEEKIKEGWEIVKFMVERIRRMVLDILFYAKKRELKWEKVDVISFANEVAMAVEPKIQKQEIEFVRDFDPAVGEFEIDTGYVHSALINILDNALDACVKDESKESHKITFSVHQDRRYIFFDVSDNGVGMDKETAEKIFTLFFSSKGSKGTGFGLFVSNRIIQQHGGEIQVKSRPGEGSLFSVKIPKTLPESSKTEPE